ncbi:GumC family protein [Oricola nitratireducens]|uniref:GumC family protein n=1 Tax=Oricola nitratireducens TaxID=2775868 RepID=UPI001866A9AF|nr:Wzz/FepE/Etk N-terminal domain-containing protein [Oricola nitratireducens]
MSRTEYGAQDADIDIGRLFGAVWRDRLRILGGAVFLTGLVFVILSFMTPEYSSDARILIESSESVFTRPQGDQGQSPDASLLDREGVASQVEILTSSDLLMQVARELKLDQNSEFDETLSMSSLKAGLVALGLIEDPSLVSSEKRILDNIRKRLNVYAIDNSRVIAIGFKSRDKELAAKFPDALAKAYLALESKSQLETTGKAASYLGKEIKDLQESVRKAEAAVANFRASSDLLVGQNNSVLATQQLAEMASELSRVRAARSSAEARADSIKTALDRGTAIETLPDVVQSPLIGRLREREIQLKAEIADLSTTLLPGHPRIKGLRSQLQDLSRQIRDEARKVLDGVRSEADVARSRETELSADLDKLKAASASANEREVQLRALEREAQSQRALLESYLVRYREAASRDEGNYAPAKARLISRAVVPSEPTFPKMIPLLGASFFVSLLVMMLATLMRELFSGRAFVPVAGMASSAVERSEPAVVAEAEPAIEMGEEAELPVQPVEMPEEPLVAARQDEASVEPEPEPDTEPESEEDAEAPADNDNYGIPSLTRRLIETGADRAIVVSPEGDAGAAASVGLARALAGEGQRIVLIDLTSGGAASKRMLEDPECPGITDLLAASSSYSDVIYPDFATNAHIIPTGIADPARAMRAMDRLPIILDALASAYDIVIVECGPTNADGLRRLVRDGGQIAISVVDPDAPEIVETAGNLLDAGFEDLTLIAADATGNGPQEPGPRRAYAR